MNPKQNTPPATKAKAKGRAAPTHKTVFVVDDHDIVRFAIMTLVNSSDVMHTVGDAADIVSATFALQRLQPDLVICDMSMGTFKGMDTVRAVCDALDNPVVLIVSMHDELLYAEQALIAGAKGFLMKDKAQENLLAACHALLNGEQWVSPRVTAQILARVTHPGSRAPAASGTVLAQALSGRELQVLQKLGLGKTTKETAFELGISPRTVDIHRARLKLKLGLRSGSELVAYAASKQ
jgi:DNA-binding NarL/FixJ family response regulator